MLVVDVQERLLPAVSEPELVLRNNLILVKAFRLFGRPVAFSEQYPQGLGHTVPALLTEAGEQPVISVKTRFSAADCVAGGNGGVVVISGVETHICVRQTALDLLEQGRRVAVVADAVSSRNPEHKRLALEELRAGGAAIVSAESLLFDWLADARHPLFKAVSKLIK